MMMLVQVLLGLLVDREVYSPVGKEGKQRWTQAPVQSTRALVLRYFSEDSCIHQTIHKLNSLRLRV